MHRKGPVHDSYGPQDLVVAHISQSHVTILAHMQDPQSEFYDVLIPTHRILWYLQFVATLNEFQLRYHNFMMIGDSGANKGTFHVLRVWSVVTRELIVREELEWRGISYDTLPQIFFDTRGVSPCYTTTPTLTAPRTSFTTSAATCSPP